MRIRVPLLILTVILLTSACGGTAEVVETQDAVPLPVQTATTEIVQGDQQPTAEPAIPTEDSLISEFVIIPSLSEARFYIDELLRGEPNTVEGVAEQVLGGVIVESLSPLIVDVQPVQIKASSFVTDNNFRNRAISEFILQSGQFPNILFTPVEVVGLPESGEPGQDYRFEVIGELTIRDVTQPVTFQVSLNAESAESISGSARATINRADFGLNIPSVPQVAEVSEEVILEFDFTAERVSS